MGTGTESRALPRQTGAISTALTAFAGFAAGASLMGLLAFTRHPINSVADAVAVPVSGVAGHDAPKTVGSVDKDSAWPGKADEALTWPFESGTAALDRIPGPKRPDRLSAPEGWTYDPRAQAPPSD